MLFSVGKQSEIFLVRLHWFNRNLWDFRGF